MKKPIFESNEWTRVNVTGANRCNLPRVLLIGDSIVEAYRREVETRLDGKALVATFTTSTFCGDPYFRSELELLLNRFHFEVIHANNGLHGCGYSEEEYRRGLNAMIDLFRTDAPEAALLWGMTTPVTCGGIPEELHPELNPRVIERNRIAGEIMKQRGIAVDNQYEVVAGHPEYRRPDGYHFNDVGSAALGRRATEFIMEALEGPSGREVP